MVIRNIIFDLGGVLLNIDYQATFQCFKGLGVTDFNEFFTQSNQTQLFDRFDRGEVGPQEFRDKVRAITGLPLTDRAIDHCWNAMLLDLPWHRVELLDGVRTHYRTFLLSNTNAIHYPALAEYLRREFGVDSLEGHFEKQYLSHEIGLRKPDRKVYRLILEENGLKPGQTLFIDDSLQHVEGARDAGLKALWLNVDQLQVSDLFDGDFRLRNEVKGLLLGP
jgi:putative hydrolase of the HAD superfamily